MLGLPWGSSSRRRCGGGARLGRGHGRAAARVSARGERRGRESRQPRGRLYAPRGPWDEEGARGGHGSTASMAPVFSLAPQ